jgi:hypothetical protein
MEPRKAAALALVVSYLNAAAAAAPQRSCSPRHPISFKLLYGLVVLRHARKRLVTISVTSNPTAEWIAGQVTDAFPWDEAPHHLVRDRDGAFGPAYTHRIRAMGIRDHPRNYASYYNQVRTHLSLRKNAPDFRRPQKLGPIAAISIPGGLHHQYVRV